MARVSTGWRSRLLAAACLIPALAATALLCAVQAQITVSPQAPPFGDPPPRSIADAITRGYGVEQTFAFIRDGADVNAPVTVYNQDYVGGTPVTVTPLVLAVATRRAELVAMLLNLGARVELPQNLVARCLALDIGDAEIEQMLAAPERGGAGGGPDCPPPRPDARTPLLGRAFAPSADRPEPRQP